MEFLYDIWNILQILIGYNLVLPIFLFVLWLIFRKRASSPDKNSPSLAPDYAIIVTAYEQTDSLPGVVASILKLNYQNYLIYIVADKCDITNLHFADERVHLLRPAEVIASNTGSHLYAMDNFVRPHDKVTIIDSDNLVDSEYLNQLNIYFEQGFKAVQGARMAKNLDTTFSCLDAARDIYYHFYDGELLFQLGSSATLAGSGMAFNADLYRDFLNKNNVKGAGFDKLLQYYILKNKERIAFNKKAIVYDEKTSQSEQLVKQRARWINTWFKYFKFGFTLVLKGIQNLNFNQFLFGVILLRPPLFIFIILSFFCMLISLFIQPIVALFWIVAFVLFVVSFTIPILSSETDARIIKSLKNIPIFMFLQIKSLIKSRNANKISVATTHFHTQTKKGEN